MNIQLSQKNKKLLGDDFLAEVNDILDNDIDDYLRIACIGLYNQGKSSLLNALVGDFNESTFKVSDRKETTNNQEYYFNDIIYIDTPGLNAEDSDDSAAIRAIKKSDLFIFVHKLSGGGLTAPEETILKKIYSIQCSSKDFLNRFIFVLSNIEGKDDAEIKRIESIYNQELRGLFHTSPFIVSVGTSSYIKAMRENKKILAQKSNYQILLDELSRKIYMYKENLHSTKQQHIRSKVNTLIEQLDSYINQLNEQLDSKKTIVEDFKNDLKKYTKLKNLNM